MHSILENVKITNIKVAESTATTGSVSAAIDMAGYDGVVFMRKAGAARTFTVHGSNTGATATDFAATTAAVTTTATGQTAVIEVRRPALRYLKLDVGAGVTAVYSEAYAIQFKARNAPIDNNAAAVDGFKVGQFQTATLA